MVGVKRTPKSSKKITKQVKEVVSTKKRLCKDTENEKLTECLFLKPQVNFNDSNDFKTPERNVTTSRSRLRNQIDYVRLNDPQKKTTKQSIPTNTSFESISETHSENPRKRARKSSQTKNEDSHLQIVTPTPKPEKIILSQPTKIKSVKSSSKQLKESKNKVNSKPKNSDFDKKFLEEKSLCNTLNQQTSESRLPKNQNLSESVQSSDNNASFSGMGIYKSTCDPLKIIKEENSSFTSGEQSETSNSCGTYLRNRRKICYKIRIKESKKDVPSVTSSHVPSVTSLHLPSVTSSHVPSVTSLHLPSVTSSHVPSVTSSYVPSVKSSYLPSVTSSHVPSVTFSHVTSVTSSHVPFVTSSHVPSVTSSFVPSVTSSHVLSVTSSHVPYATSSHVPYATSSHVPYVTSSHVPSVTSSHVSSVTSSYVPSVTPSHIPNVTSSHVPFITSSHVPNVTASLAPSVIFSHVSTITSSHDPIVTSSFVPIEGASHVPTETSSHVFTEASSHSPNVTSSHVSTGTSSHVPTEADSYISTVTSSITPTKTGINIETGFDHEQNKLKLDNDFTEVQMKMCPTCKEDFPDLIFNEHVLQCLKKQFQSSTHRPFEKKKTHTQISQDELLAQKLHKELNKNVLIANDSLESDKILCCICKTDLTCLNSLQRTQHINTCIDQSENAKASPGTVSEPVVICPMCGLQFKSFSLREMHFQSCTRDKFIVPGQHITNVHGEPSRLMTNKRQSKNKKTSKSKKAPDDQLELALAMSNSLQEEQNKQEEQLSRYIQNVKKEVLKELKNQKNKQLPLLVRLTNEERQECNAEKVANIMNENFENVSLSKKHKHSSLASTEPTNLWLKSSLTQADSSKLPFYVNSLMPPIEVDVVNVENRLTRLSRNTRSFINQNTTDFTNEQNNQQSIAPSQTALILAELANDNEPANDSMPTPVKDESPNIQGETNGECSTGLLTSLSSDLCQLINNPSFSDVQFMTADGTKVFGHKIILQLRCPNILNIISNNLETPTIHLEEVSYDLLIVFLRYIYAGQLNIDETQARNLKILSQELEVPELFYACEKMLKTSVNHNQQRSAFYPSPLKTVDSIIDYLFESSDEDPENRNSCPENPSCDYKILGMEKQPQHSQNNNQSMVTRDSAKFQNSTNTSPNVISPSNVLRDSLNGHSGDNGSNLDYLSNVPVSSISSQLGTSAQLPEINCDNQPNKPLSNYNIDHLFSGNTDSNPCDTVMTWQKSPSNLTSLQNAPHSPQSEKCFMINKNMLPSFTSSLPLSTNLTDNSNNNSENREQYQLNNADLIKDFSPIHIEDESFNSSPCFSPKTKPYYDDITTPEKDNIHNNRENVSTSVLSLSDDLSNMSKELFSDEELETAENNKTSIENSIDNQHELTSAHQIAKNISPCHKENNPDFSKYSFSNHETIFFTKDKEQINKSPNVNNNVSVNPVCRIIYTSQSLTSSDESDKEFTPPLPLPPPVSLSTETDCNLEEKFDFLNSSSPVFPKTQEVKNTGKNLNEDQSGAFSQNQYRKRKRCSLSNLPLSTNKIKKKLETEENSHLNVYDRSSSILNSDYSDLETNEEEQFSQNNSLNLSANVCNDSGGSKVGRAKSKTNMITVTNDSYENTHQYKIESDLDISKDTCSDISVTTNLQISPKQSNDPKSNRESNNSASPVKNSSYETDSREIHEESYISDDIDETMCGKVLFSELNNFIRNNPDLYRKILEYEPLDFDVLKKRLGESNIKCSNKKLHDYLENQCITFTLDKDKRSRKKSCSPQKRKTVKEKLKSEESNNLNLYDRNCSILNSDQSYLETMEKEEELSEKCSLNSSVNDNIYDDLYNGEDMKKSKQFNNDVINEEETSGLKKLSSNISNDFCSTKEYQMGTPEKPKKRFTFKKITAKSSICSSTENKSVDIGNSDCLVKSFTEPSSSDNKLRNSEHLQSNHNVTNDVWEHFYDDNFDDSVVAFSPVPSHSKVNLNSSKDKLDLSLVVEQNLDHSLTYDCSYSSIVNDVKHLSSLESELNCNLSDSFENRDLKMKPNPNKTFETPANVNHQTNYYGKEQSILSPFTPMPDYDKMSTPGLKKEMKKYGCKTRPKKNMIKVLKDIFIRTHQYKSDSELDTSRDTNNEISETNRLPKSPPESKNSKTNKESAEGISPINSSSFENDGVMIYEESYIDDDTEEVTSSQQSNAEILFSKVNHFIQTKPDLYRKILLYEPLDFDVLKKDLEESHIKCSANKLLEYLDNQCITFVVGKDKQNKRKAHRGRGRPRRGKKV